MNDEVSYRIRCLVHYVGDIHQPLHAVSKYSKKQPKGDYGGNGYWISSYGAFKNLHSLWDSGMNKYVKGINPPLNDYKEWPALSAFADEISSKYPRSEVHAESLDP